VGSKQAEFERVAMPHTRSLLRVARRLTSEPARAEDLVQDTMLFAWRGFHQFQQGTNVRAWLFKIMFNAHYAQGRKIRATPEPLPIEARETPVHAGVQERVEVMQALDQLPQEHRAVLLLGVVEGFTCREMADILEIPIGTVMSRLSRARDGLRERLTPVYTARGAQ
jgi:RNA polymerase sigma-70 factor (ECF subfamily)